MATTAQEPGDPIVIDLEPSLQRRVELLAGARGLSVADFVVAMIRDAVAGEHADSADHSASWSQLSSRSFARDWDFEEERACDALS